MKMIKTLTSKAVWVAAFAGFAISAPAILPAPLVPAAIAASSKATVDNAKASGQVGERADGYLGVVSSVSAEVQAAIDDINIQRKSVYTRLAGAQNVSVNVVAALSGEKLLAKAKPGEKIMTANGQWTTK